MENRQSTDGGDRIGLIELWKVVVRRRRLIIGISAAALIISVIVSLILPKSFASTASVMPPQQESSLASAALASAAGGLGGIAQGFLGGKSPADIWVGILDSRTVRDQIVNRLDLRNWYGKSSMEAARNALKGHVSIRKTKESILYVTVEDRDPVMAARIANAYVEELDRVNRGAAMTVGQRMRVFVEKRLAEAKSELSRAEGALTVFHKRNKVVKLDEQSKAIIEAIGSVKGQLMAKEVELETLSTYAAPSNPMVQILTTEVDSLRAKLLELETQGVSNRKKDIFIPTDTIPDLANEYARLMREAKIQLTLFELLTQQYEMARIQEAKDTPTIQVLDQAVPAERKSKPRRSLIVLLSTTIATLAAISASFILEYRNRLT